MRHVSSAAKCAQLMFLTLVWTLNLIEKLRVRVIIFLNLVLLLIEMKWGDEIDLAVKGDLWGVVRICMYGRY